MAKKISKVWKRVFSLLFHALILIGFIALYDSGKAVYDSLNLGRGGEEEAAEEEKEKGTTMAELLAQRQQKKKAAEKAAKTSGLAEEE